MIFVQSCYVCELILYQICLEICYEADENQKKAENVLRLKNVKNKHQGEGADLCGSDVVPGMPAQNSGGFVHLHQLSWNLPLSCAQAQTCCWVMRQDANDHSHP